MQKASKFNVLLAVLIDYLFILFVATFLIAIVGRLINDSIITDYSHVIFMLFTPLFISVFYYLFFSSQSSFLTVGELSVGGKIYNGKKSINNPYQLNRWFFCILTLFTSFFIFLDVQSLASPFFPLALFMIKVLRIVLLFMAIAFIGRGKTHGVWFAISTFLINIGVAYYFHLFQQADVLLDEIVVNGLIIVLYLILFFWYRQHLTSN